MAKSKKTNISNKMNYFINDIRLLDLLLKDCTTKLNIIWATDDYTDYGAGFSASDSIKSNMIFRNNFIIIKPRIEKSLDVKNFRIKEKAEVYTPSWVCNQQNNQIDEIWFEEKNTFNLVNQESWSTNYKKIKFTKKSWKEYVLDKRLEIACGEAPYVVSRYDSVTGKKIKLMDRIGILDRKLRVVSENTETSDEWFTWAINAFKSTYGFEWQGDSLFIARNNLILSFVEHYSSKFNSEPQFEKISTIAEIITWNFWQMDGTKMVIPNSCKLNKSSIYNLFGEEVFEDCIGCKNDNKNQHRGIYSNVMDWDNNKLTRFADFF